MRRGDFFQKSSKYHNSCITVIQKIYIGSYHACRARVHAIYRFNSLHLLFIFPLKKTLINSAEAIFLQNALAFIVFM